MEMVEHQLKQKLHRLLRGGGQNETRLVLAGAGMTIVQHVGGRFEAAAGGDETYVQDDDGIVLSQRRASYDGPGMGTNDTLDIEPVQFKVWSGETGLYNLLDGSFLDADWLLNRPACGLENKDLRAMTGFKYALLEAQVFLDERLWKAFDAAPREDNKALKVAVRAVGDGVSSGALASPVDMAVRVLAQGVPDELKPHTAQVLVDINAAVDAAAADLGDAPDEEALRLALIARLSTLKRTVHFKTFHPDRAARSGLGVELATKMAAWLEEVYAYILRRRLGDGGDAEEQVTFERA
eukprot:617774-Prymnesium_polylepis.1